MSLLEFVLNKVLTYLFLVLNYVNEYKIIIYPIFFTIYFFMYYSMIIPQVLFTLDEKTIKSINEKIDTIAAKISILVVLCLTFLGFISLFSVLKFYFKDKYQRYYVWILLSYIIICNVLIPLLIISYGPEISVVSNNDIMKTIFYIVSTSFYIIFLGIFIFNTSLGNSDFKKLFPFDSNDQLNSINFLNLEFVISLIIILIYFICYICITNAAIRSVNYKLENYDAAYLTLTTNCTFKPSTEQFDNDNNNSPNSPCMKQIKKILEKYGDNYLKTLDNIPIAFFNKKLNDYQDLIIADFYYPGSYYTYTAASPLSSIPSLSTIRTAMNEYKVRIVHLDIYMDASNNEPIVRSEKMKDGAEALSFIDCLNEIDNNAWKSNECSKNNYPLFLYLKFNFDETKDISINYEIFYIKVFEYLMRVFSTRLMDKKYSFSGRNGTFNVSTATIKEALNKIIIMTNKYPTHSVLDEIINGCSNELNFDLNIKLYKKSYIDYPYPNGPGLSQDFNKNDLLNNSKKNLYFFYSEPNETYTNPQQIKSGLYNPSFQDCAQYGCQGTLMYLFTPDNNFKLWKDYFDNMNNFQPVLKEEILRGIDKKIPVIHEQPNELVLGPPKEKCITKDADGNCVVGTNK